jgi:phosphoesterase RecJ-like protein
MKVNWKLFRDVISQAKRVLLTSHIRPDCDALGSELGMAGILDSLGKEVRIVNGQATPANLQFIDPEHRIMAIDVDVTADELTDIDLLVIIDTSAWIQLGKMADVVRNSTCKKIIFDHHVGEDDIDAQLFKDTAAEAAGRMVVEAADQLGVSLTREIARPLLAALATDTGWFRFPSVSENTFAVAARLLRAGAVPAEIYNHLYERETAGRVRLRGVVLSRIVTELGGRLAHTYILLDDFAETGAQPTETEDLINEALEIDGTVFAVILVEQAAGGFKISFRSRCGVECNQVASAFGGGGHKAAAGAFIHGDFESVQHRVLSHVRASMKLETAGR